MTQLTFDFSATTGFSSSNSRLALLVRETKTREANPERHEKAAQPSAVHTSAKARKANTIRTGQSLSLYESGRKDLHHIGDLAQAVINRYEIVNRRRAARLAREKAAREQAALQTN